MASPVDFISGDSLISIPDSFANENAGTFTYHLFFSSGFNPLNPCSSRLMPSITLDAISARLYPVALDRNGTVLEDLGFTSIIYTFSEASTMNWMLNRPQMPIPRPSFSVYSLIVSLTFSEMERGG